MKYTFYDLINDALSIVQKLLFRTEIWEKGVKFGFSEKLDSIGVTPWKTAGARIYTDMKNNPNPK